MILILLGRDVTGLVVQMNLGEGRSEGKGNPFQRLSVVRPNVNERPIGVVEGTVRQKKRMVGPFLRWTCLDLVF